ncbi:CoB--CoM heterodisulfide reductase iron-sulfur subunit A family protein, partial [bacterium]|nr:CoB--CoM heterodisulfide reductase iron-sulfur subunit A family protein [bacterium]
MAEKRKKTLLFLCNCGTNIANSVDMESLADWAEKSGDIDIVERHNLLCSPDGKKFFEESLGSNKPESIIIAACSPKMHEKTFHGLTEEAGLNLSSVQLANIREQCAWVTLDKAEATEKSKMLINAAIKRSWLSEEL